MLPYPTVGTTSGYLTRYLDDEIDELPTSLTALALDGAEGVGKTETASPGVDVTLELNSPDVLSLVSMDTHTQVQRASRVCIDQ